MRAFAGELTPSHASLSEYSCAGEASHALCAGEAYLILRPLPVATGVAPSPTPPPLRRERGVSKPETW